MRGLGPHHSHENHVVSFKKAGAIVVVSWIRPSAVRRQEQGETPQSIDAVATAIISKCH